MQSTNKDAALLLVSQGLHIFPCNSDKTPMIAAWEQSAFNSPFAVGIKWDANPEALPAIPVGAHGIVVIDCDRKQAGIDGVAAFHGLCADHRIDLSGAFVVETPSTGQHYYFKTEAPYGNSRGSLPDGIDVRGVGGFTIAPGATLPDGRGYRQLAGSWDALPPLPEALAAFLKAKRPATAPEPSVSRTEAVTDRESAYAENAMADECAALASMRPGQGRNAALNQASHSIGTMVGAGWIERETAEQALWEAAERNGYRAKDGDAAAWKTLQSGIDGGMSKPRDPLPTSEVPQWVRETVANLLTAHQGKRAVAAANQVGKRSVALMQGSDIEAQPITWLWHGYLPQSKLSLLAGAGGTGKSTIAFSLAGTITNGGLWPDGSQCRSAGNVLIWSSEDDPADTIKPRLMAVGANERRYGVIKGVIDEEGISCPFDASRDMDALREAVNRIGGISMLVIDPIVSAVVGDMHKANDVRRSLQAIVDFAAEMNCAVLGITHFAKSTAGKNSAERVIGSQAFAALARMVLVAAKEEESNRRVFTRAKSNNSVDKGGFSYSIEAINLHNGIEATRVEWGEALEGSSRSILAQVEGEPSEDVSQLGVAKQFLIESLRNGPVASKELMEHAREGYNVSNITLRRAQKELGIVAAKVAFAGGWMWSLPLANPSQLNR